MNVHLPTLRSASWTITALRESIALHLARDRQGLELRLFFYAVTEPGWQAIRSDIGKWVRRKAGRQIIAHIGTDDAITSPEALRLMMADGVRVYLMTSYTGVYHPKVLLLSASTTHTVWIGSNNLTRKGLFSNIEFAALLKSDALPSDFMRWMDLVHAGAVEITAGILKEYEDERQKHVASEETRKPFVWSRREKITPSKVTNASRVTAPTAPRRGDLIIEVMPRETGQGGKQIQLPIRAATRFFGLPHRSRATQVIQLSPKWMKDERRLTLTLFGNSTVRLVISELEYDDRPCLIHFSKRRSNYEFDIVSKSESPVRYRELLKLCEAPTRTGSRRWCILE